MNKLEQQIWDRYGNFELSHDKNKLIVDNINEFVQKHAVGFAKWCIKNYCCEVLFSGLWYERNSENETEYTTEQLFNLYIEQL